MISSSVCTGTRSPCAREVAVDVVLEAAALPAALRAADARRARPRAGSTIVAPARFRSSIAAMKTSTISGSGRVALVGLAQDADARALQAVALRATARRSGIGAAVAAAAVAGSSGSSPTIDLEHRDGVVDRARHRSRDVGEQAERNHAGAAGQAHRRADADQRLVRRRAADRVAGVAAEADRAEVGRDGRGGAAARSGGHAIERVRIARVAGQDRVHRLVRAERELRHVRLGEHDRAGVLDALHQERVLVRDESLERQRAGGALQADRLEVVLDDRRDAVERTGEAACAKRRSSSSACFCASGLIMHDGVDAPGRSCRRRRCGAGSARPARGRSGVRPSSRRESRRWWLPRRGMAAGAGGCCGEQGEPSAAGRVRIAQFDAHRRHIIGRDQCVRP